MAQQDNNQQPQTNDEPLSRARALRGWEITPADAQRALAKWQRRFPDLDERLQRAASGGANAESK